ncbi:DUF3290 domain-containing protein [Lacticaseibacillus zhaodongensis]|uniref:DUF3290 domain-containing protein n=1 Tax=Lacticaseibacillus zhaodongensis TaxID=2668065 RepID=UPI0012D363E1|nr:DUF3290 domain-containing protein [Lacticaseibacillus zhaodongensis]
MNFYNLHYVENQANLTNYLKYAVMALALLVMLLGLSLYWRHRMQTKYRDLALIMLLVLVFVGGVQYSDYQQANNQRNQTSQMAGFLASVADDQDVDKNQVYANTTQLSDGIVLRIRNRYYRVDLSTDASSYVLHHVHLVDHHVQLHK